MNNDELKTNYASLRTKMAAQRTFMLLIVSTKVFILLAAKKHSLLGVGLGILLLCAIGAQYYFTVNEINKQKIINNMFFDYYLLILIPILLVMSYFSWKYRKA